MELILLRTTYGCCYKLSVLFVGAFGIKSLLRGVYLAWLIFGNSQHKVPEEEGLDARITVLGTAAGFFLGCFFPCTG